ncbi:MAG: DUF4294 domain-containing protein [Capnocytophaga sp.]|nr:DUF4294 domain-containing protein [Capnocytophaga sp.]
MNYFLTIFISVGFVLSVQAQVDTTYVESDFYKVDIIRLPEVYVFDKERTFATEEERKNYLILRRRVQVVYPYARLAAERLRIMEQTMDTMTNKRQKRIYVKRMQRYVEERFTDELKKLSRSQGRILVKLIHRQTGMTAFDLVKDLRNGWSAFWYNNTAWLYDISLKSEYDPITVEEDYWIEDILLRAFSKGELEQQSPALDFDYLELTNKWRGEIKKE